MENRTVRLSKPLYEALPYFYVIAGLGAAVGSYFLARHPWSDILLVLAVFCVLGGLVILLRRRDYRAKRGEYRGKPLDENSLQ
ncbi:MAG TPA: hypothetical protein VKB41_12500 [Steroidobacteraceae bacterium]|nr:hypothetical protein [Steroidobacteraceae bacterium]